MNNEKIEIGTKAIHVFSGSKVVVLTNIKSLVVGGSIELVVDISHRGHIEKNVNVEYLRIVNQ